MGHRSVSGDAEEAGGCFWAVVTRGPKTAVPPSPGEGRKVNGTHHPVFSRGTTELTQPPWPCCLTAPCLSLPPMCASACLCQAVCRGRAQASIQGPRAQSLPVCPAPASPGLAQTVPPARLWPGPLFLCCVDLSPRGSPSCPLLLPLFLFRAARPLRKHTHTPIIQFGDGPFSPWGEEGRTLSRGQGPRGPSCGRDPTGSQLCSVLPGPLPVATVAGSSRLGSGPQAGRSEGGGWQGLQPGMCVQERGCSACGGAEGRWWGAPAERSWLLPLCGVGQLGSSLSPHLTAAHFCLRPLPGEGARG